MKRLFALTLALLALAGCGKQTEEPPQTTAQPEIQPDPGWYISNSELERRTDGAIRVYDLPTNDVLWVENIGNNLLLATKDGFTVLSGEACVVSATMTPEIAIAEEGDEFQSTSQGLAYYVKKRNEVVYLDQQLQVISRIALPEKPDGEPVIAPDGGEIFYCIGSEIRAYDTTRNITRPVKKQLVKEQTLTGYLFEGAILSCDVVFENGDQGTVYLDSQTGETRSTDNQIFVADTNQDTYFAISNDGQLRQEYFGTQTTEPLALQIPDDMTLIPAVAINGVVGVTMEEEKPTALSVYDFHTGCVVSKVALSGIDRILSASVDKWSRCLWLLVEENGVVSLCRWNPEKSKTGDSTSYVSPVYTLENPDTEGLAACEDRATDISKSYGVDIRLWRDAVSEVGAYSATVEYRTETINALLDDLEKVLEMFPNKFFRRSATRPLRLCIVRDVNGGTESVQFYKNSNAYIFLTTGCDVQTELLRGLGYVINSRVVSNSPLLDNWTSLNPEGFVYGQPQAEYLEEENRFFADEQAMDSVVEDRSSIFRYAMEEGNEEIFASDIMQEKLTLLCKGIRKVWKWDKEEVSYPWEQYLNEPLAYNKK